MKLLYARPAMTSVRERDLEAILGPVLLSSADLPTITTTVRPGASDSAIHAPAGGNHGSQNPVGPGSSGPSVPGRRR
jgi:hypothetical protein